MSVLFTVVDLADKCSAYSKHSVNAVEWNEWMNQMTINCTRRHSFGRELRQQWATRWSYFPTWKLSNTTCGRHEALNTGCRPPILCSFQGFYFGSLMHPVDMLPAATVSPLLPRPFSPSHLVVVLSHTQAELSTQPLVSKTPTWRGEMRGRIDSVFLTPDIWFKSWAHSWARCSILRK